MNLNVYYFGFQFLVLAPIYEWIIHRLLHYTNNYYHKRHHINYHNNEVKYEKWVPPLILTFYFLNMYLFLFIGIKYFIVHTIIHHYPNLLKKYSKHHITHHLYPEYNFCVTCVWPDILFNTRKIIQEK